MPRPTAPARLDNPVRQLRFELAPPARGALSQAELASIVDIPLDSLKGAESGRMSFSPLMQNRILCETGAAWNEEDKRWRFWKPNGPLYRREHYCNYRELIEKGQNLYLDHVAIFIYWRIKLLLEELPPKKQFKFFFRLNSFLGDNHKEFCPDKYIEFFKDACGFIEAIPEIDRFKPGVARFAYDERLLQYLKLDDEIWQRFNTGFDLAGYEKALKKPAPKKPKRRQTSAQPSIGGEQTKPPPLGE
jgi:hypothetical protein